MTKILLRKGKEKKIRQGDPWIFDNEIREVQGSFQPGDIVDVFSGKNTFLGRGYINPNSKIMVRILTRDDEEINREFFRKRISDAGDASPKIINQKIISQRVTSQKTVNQR